MPEKAIKLTMNEYFRARYMEMYLNSIRKRSDFDPNYKYSMPFLLEMAAGGSAGFVQVAVTNPMELLKIQGATMSEKIKAGLLAKPTPYTEIVRNLGLTGLYTGILSTLTRDIPFSMVYFSLYSQSKKRLEAMNIDPSFPAGVIAGTFAAAITCPVDVIKTRVQAAVTPKPMALADFAKQEVSLLVGTAKKVYKNEGPKAFFKGIVPRCLIISPLFGITMFCYENLLTITTKLIP
jgi:hypothetical protein